MEKPKTEQMRMEETKAEKTRTESLSPFRSVWERIRKKYLKKDQLIIGLLTGILLIVIALPVEKGFGGKEEGKKTASKETSRMEPEGAGAWETDQQLEEGTPASEGNLSGDAYTREMEERLSRTLAQVEGVGRVQVMITWKSSSEKIVEKDTPVSGRTIEETDSNGGNRTTQEESREESTVYREEADGSRSPYIVKELKPQAEGVLVIADGGGNPVTARNILEAVQALFPLDTHKIKIMKMEGSK